MSKKEVIIKKDYEEISTYTAFLIEDIVKKIKNKKSGKINIAFSGGNTPILMFGKLAELTDLNWHDINIYLVDERYVRNNHKDSNYKLLKEHLIRHINIPDENVHYIKYLAEIKNSLKDYKKQIVQGFKFKNEKQNPEFDLIHLGIGADGHTASIFQPEKIDNNQLLAVTRGKRYKRITFTYKILNNAKNILFLIAGKEKQEIVSEIINKNNKDYAAAEVNNKGKLYYLLDKEASLNL